MLGWSSGLETRCVFFRPGCIRSSLSLLLTRMCDGSRKLLFRRYLVHAQQIAAVSCRALHNRVRARILGFPWSLTSYIGARTHTEDIYRVGDIHIYIPGDNYLVLTYCCTSAPIHTSVCRLSVNLWLKHGWTACRPLGVLDLGSVFVFLVRQL